MAERAVAVVSAESAVGKPVRDTILLDHEQRRAPGGTLTGLRGTRIEVVLFSPRRLRHEDRLILENGDLVEIVARPEPLFELRSPDLASLARLAWLLGDHHIPVEIHERRLRLRRTDAARALLQPLGVRLLEIEAPFEPEGGAYDHSVQR